MPEEEEEVKYIKMGSIEIPVKPGIAPHPSVPRTDITPILEKLRKGEKLMEDEVKILAETPDGHGAGARPNGNCWAC